VENLRGESQMRHWIVFDGDVDPEWVENLNSVLDDNKALTLPNGERISLPSNVRVIFEAENLRYATPATVSRCGMIWFGDDVVTSKMLFSNQVHRFAHSTFDEVEEDIMAPLGPTITADTLQKEFTEVINTIMNSLEVDEVVEKASGYFHIMEWDPRRSIESFFSLMKAACLKLQNVVHDRPAVQLSPDIRKQYIVKSIILALTWSFTGDCSLGDRAEFGQFLMLGGSFVEMIPEQCQSILDFDVSTNNGTWESWLSKVPEIELDVHAITRTDIVVPTIDTSRHEALVFGLLKDHKSIILCGPPGSGKTMTLFGALRKSSNLDVVGVNFSKGTTPQLLINTLEQYCEYKKTVNGTVLSPSKIGRWLVIFCDEINLPATDKYGTQKVISLLRQMMEQGGFWKEDEKFWVTISNIQFVGACNPPTDVGRNELSSRFLRHCCLVLVDQPAEISLNQIYLAFNTALLKVIPSLRGYNKDLTNAMVEFYLEQQKKYKQSAHAHYIYSPRELTRWSRGIFEAIRPLENLTIDGLVRLWAHEALRLFHDRLVEEPDRDWTKSLIRSVATKYFGSANLKIALKEPILYSNWLSRLYRPVEKTELVQFLKARMKIFGEEEFDTSLVLFDDLLDHVLRIDRVLKQPQGHLILIGISSSGKVSYYILHFWNILTRPHYRDLSPG
jgi:dynein heavy chain 1, cytosolic